MSEPFLGEIKMFGGNFAPRGYALCDGQLLPINQNTALFSLLGTIYGGDGRTSFALPDLRGRVPVHEGTGPGLSPVQLGSRGGSETTTLNISNLPPHDHTATLHGEKVAPTDPNPSGRMLAGGSIYASPDPKEDKTMASGSVKVQSTGGGQSFNNRPPYLGMNYIIALQGLYPSRN